MDDRWVSMDEIAELFIADVPTMLAEIERALAEASSEGALAPLTGSRVRPATFQPRKPSWRPRTLREPAARGIYLPQVRPSSPFSTRWHAWYRP